MSSTVISGATVPEMTLSIYIVTCFEYIADEPHTSTLSVLGIYADMESAKIGMQSDAKDKAQDLQETYDAEKEKDDPELLYYVVPRGNRLIVVGIPKDLNINLCPELGDYTGSNYGDKFIYEIHQH